MYKGKFASELSMHEVKEYYDELRQKCPRTDEQWADFNILQEKLIVFAYKILDGKTNGDMIETMFPNAEITVGRAKGENITMVYLRNNNMIDASFYQDWWNALFKTESEEK